ncbi:MAG TPA: AAA family ATPase [Candidatus Saccharimonadales bacterium]|nr:AAA family ATPase [Candidatus Saccharimonadales bacterium]
MQSKVQAKKKFVLILYGFPGSGKSTFAREFASELQNTIHINFDKIRQELGKELQRKNADSANIYEPLVEYMTNEFLEAGFNIVLDIPVLTKSSRRKVMNLAKKANAKLVMVWLQIDSDSAFNRLKKRDKRKISERYAKDYTRSEFESVINASQNPNDEDYVVISGKHTFHTQKLAVFKKLKDMKVLTAEQTINKRIKPELVNLIPQSLRNREDIKRRDISIR